ncbi:hypothetical protein F5X68DRAFT_204454 [Plectosphaerella plurivora]|uniref:Uncharacterized protein n=1 Tax=Plectosphaerella plurivora TaxID=936078 RepID=A0A9P8VDA2_9PEZI|nr:hypothetical protein F5X68DRAFT_204454 [Plectosphaerella plurivora]
MVARSLPLLQPLPFLNLCRQGVACRTWSWLHNLSNCIRRRKHCSQRLFQSNHGQIETMSACSDYGGWRATCANWPDALQDPRRMSPTDINGVLGA